MCCVTMIHVHVHVHVNVHVSDVSPSVSLSEHPLCLSIPSVRVIVCNLPESPRCLYNVGDSGYKQHGDSGSITNNVVTRVGCKQGGDSCMSSLSAARPPYLEMGDRNPRSVHDKTRAPLYSHHCSTFHRGCGVFGGYVLTDH